MILIVTRELHKANLLSNNSFQINRSSLSMMADILEILSNTMIRLDLLIRSKVLTLYKKMEPNRLP